MHDKNTTIALYAAGAAVTALGLAYIFGPSIFPDDAGYRGTRAGGAVGLSNPANDCFINSVLQALAGVGGLKEYLEELHEPCLADADFVHVEGPDDASGYKEMAGAPEAGISKELAITSALRVMLKRLSERPAYRKTISARGFISVLEHVFGSHINRRQQDAQEFLQVVLEKLDDEYLALSKSSQSEHPKADIQLPNLPIAGSISSQITCLTCDYQPEPNTSSFLTLTLNVPHNCSSTTLDACLDGLLKQETIEDYMCEGCMVSYLKTVLQDELERSTDEAVKENLATTLSSLDKALHSQTKQDGTKRHVAIELDNIIGHERVEAVRRRFQKSKPGRGRIQKHTSIARFPRVLAIHLSRSVFDPSAFSTKNTAKVEFPEVLVLGSIGEKRRRYRLSTMITHRGGHNSGHYETFARVQEEETLDKATSEYPSSPSELARDDYKAELKVIQGRDEKSRAPKHKPRLGDRWWRISDDKISECRSKDMLSMQKEVYMLFYELK